MPDSGQRQEEVRWQAPRAASNMFHPFPRRVVANPSQGKPYVILLRSFLIAISFSAFLFVLACSTVGSEVQAGRNALQTGRANDAVGYLTQAAAADPNY